MAFCPTVWEASSPPKQSDLLQKHLETILLTLSPVFGLIYIIDETSMNPKWVWTALDNWFPRGRGHVQGFLVSLGQNPTSSHHHSTSRPSEEAIVTYATWCFRFRQSHLGAEGEWNHGRRGPSFNNEDVRSCFAPLFMPK